MKPVTSEWLVLAKKDVASCQKMRGDDFLTNIVSFHAQQAVEKSFKAVIEEFEIGFIRTHDLFKLYETIKDRLEFDIDVEMVKKLNEVYTSARYPGEFGLLPSGDPELEDSEAFYEFARDTFEKVSAMLSKHDNMYA